MLPQRPASVSLHNRFSPVHHSRRNRYPQVAMVREQRPEDRQNRFVAGITVHSGSKTSTSGRSNTSIDALHFADDRYGSAPQQTHGRNFTNLIKRGFPRPGFPHAVTSRPSPSISCPAASQPSSSSRARYAFQSPPGAAPAP